VAEGRHSFNPLDREELARTLGRALLLTPCESLPPPEPFTGAGLYAYLRYSVGGKTVTTYVGDATAETRAEALRKAWRAACGKGLLKPRSLEAADPPRIVR